MRAGTFALGAVEGDGERTDWDMVHGLMMDSIYGGRVDNEFDNRVLKTYLDKYFNDKMVGGGEGLMKGVKVPTSNQIGDYLDAINKIPEVDAPMVFSLPDNIERSVQRARSTVVIEQLGLMKSAGVESGGFDREVWKSSLGPIIELWEKLMEGGEMGGVMREGGRGKKGGGEKGGKEGADDPVDDFVGMEFDFGVELVGMVNGAIMTLKKILYGSGLLTPEALSVAGDLIRGVIPRSWEKKYEGPSKPMAYCTSICVKTGKLKEWKRAVKDGSLLKESVNLCHLFRPGTFFGAFKQQSARALRCSMDDLLLESSWDARRGVDGAELPIMVEGLLLQGAVFNGDFLTESASNAKEVCSAPTVVLGFVKGGMGKGGKGGGKKAYENAISVPVYWDLSRERMLTEVSVPCSQGEQGTWVLAGVALMLQE